MAGSGTTFFTNRRTLLAEQQDQAANLQKSAQEKIAFASQALNILQKTTITQAEAEQLVDLTNQVA